MRINVVSVMVDDQAKALRFYTDVLGFVTKREIPLGEHAWLTVVSPEAPDGTELSLEPDEHPAARPFKRALVEDGIPSTTSRPSTSVWSSVGCGSRSPRPTWARSRRRCSTTPAATSSRSRPRKGESASATCRSTR